MIVGSGSDEGYGASPRHALGGMAEVLETDRGEKSPEPGSRSLVYIGKRVFLDPAIPLIILRGLRILCWLLGASGGRSERTKGR